MAHPKRRQSKSRKNTRRNQYKIKSPQLSIDSHTKQVHILHHAHWYNDKLYYRGKILLDKKYSDIK